MSFTFGAPKSATGFTLPTNTTTPTSTTFQLNMSSGGGDVNTSQAKPLTLFGTTTQNNVPATTTTFPSFNFGSTTTTTATAPTGLTFSLSPSTVTTSLSTSTVASTSTAPLNFGNLVSSTTTTATIPITTLATTTAPLLPLGSITTLGASALPSTSSMTFVQLEEAINKWTVDLEEQGKIFGNQAKHLNAWDRLLISNGEKILTVSNGIEKIKEQQQQLDQELDFVLAQQKELEDCIVPLENELKDIPVTDVDRDQTYKLAENIDANLKQMSEDLKEIIEQLNESNKAQELSDPVAQIGRILNAHMNSLQWIDRNTTQISNHLDEINKMHDWNKRTHEKLHNL